MYSLIQVHIHILKTQSAYYSHQRKIVIGALLKYQSQICPFYTPCICFDDIIDGAPYNPELRYYAGHGRCYPNGNINGSANLVEIHYTNKEI